MRRIFAAIGMISIGVVVLVIAALAYAFYEGGKLDREATDYSVDAVVAITTAWDLSCGPVPRRLWRRR